MDDIYRPNFHFTPPHSWMNDPNGMVWHAGMYHLFYQFHPENMVWGAYIIKLRIFIDASSVEVFANDGLLAFTECIFPNEQSDGPELFAEGGDLILHSLDIYQLNRALFQIGENPT